MADERLLALVVGEGDGAGTALGHEAAVAALHEGGAAAAVEEEDRLLAGVERATHAGWQAGG